MEELSPESKALYELLMIDTKEEYEKRFLDYKKKVLDAMKSTAPLRALSGAASSSCFCEPCPRSNPTPAATSASSDISRDDLCSEARRLYDNLDEPAAATSPTSSTTISATRSTATSIRAATSTHDLVAASLDSSSAFVHSSSTLTAPPPAPESAETAFEVSTVLQDPSVAPIAVNINGTEVSALMPTNCSYECPSDDASISLSELAPLAAPTQSMTTSDHVSELAECTEKCRSVSRHRSNDVLTLPPLTTTVSAGLELRPVPWPSFEYSQV